MARVQRKNTAPEMIVRRLIHSAGYRYRLHKQDLPGKPDLAFVSRRKVIFVHGCFWHQHDCAKAKRPTTNVGFWNAKLDRNVARDRENIENLRKAEWHVFVIWECETVSPVRLFPRISAFLDKP